MKTDKLELKKAIIESNKDIVKNTKPLDEDEYRLLDIYKNEKIDDINILTEEKDLKEFKIAQKEFQKSKQITMRISNRTIDKIKSKAESYGMNYQTYINLFLYQLAEGKFVIELK